MNSHVTELNAAASTAAPTPLDWEECVPKDDAVVDATVALLMADGPDLADVVRSAIECGLSASGRLVRIGDAIYATLVCVEIFTADQFEVTKENEDSCNEVAIEVAGIAYDRILEEVASIEWAKKPNDDDTIDEVFGTATDAVRDAVADADDIVWTDDMRDAFVEKIREAASDFTSEAINEALEAA